MARCSLSLSLLLVACSGTDATSFPVPDLPGVAEGTAPFLAFPERAEDWARSPVRLSLTGVFADLETLQPSLGLLPYDVSNPLFSDGAQKGRWLAFPSGGQIAFSEQGAWSYPEGTVFVKQFDIALDERVPSVLQRLETRFLIAAQGGGFYGITYAWNEEQTDAELVLEARDDTLVIVGEEGVTRTQTYSYPSHTDCPKCHSDIVGGVLGARTAQLNREFLYVDGSGQSFGANQLAIWEQLGFFDRPVGNRPYTEYPQLAALADEARSVEDRVRSYWESNCSMCHNDVSPIPSWDARYQVPLDKQGVVLAESYVGPRSDDTLVVAPGSLDRSLMYVVATNSDPLVRMPPLLRNRVDAEYVALLERWIQELPQP